MVLFLQLLLVVGILNQVLVGMFLFCILVRVIRKLKLDCLPDIVWYLVDYVYYLVYMSIFSLGPT